MVHGLVARRPGSRLVGSVTAHALAHLPERQQSVGHLMALPLTTPEAAAMGGLAIRTVEDHWREIRATFGLTDGYQGRSVARIAWCRIVYGLDPCPLCGERDG